MSHPGITLFAALLVAVVLLVGRRQARRASAVMHIETGISPFGGVRTVCGKTLRPNNAGPAGSLRPRGWGVPYGAPMCPVCARRAGWTHDRRRTWR